MNYLESYLNAVEERDPGVSLGLQNSVIEFQQKYLDKFEYVSHRVGMLLGHVQSGKTGQMLGIISAAADLDFKFFVILTTDNIRLQKQTVTRAKLSLNGIVICDENDDVLFKKNSFIKPVLVILKKNRSILTSWQRNFAMSELATMEPLLILDDEGDAASLNTQVNQDDVSVINSLIRDIRHQAPSSLYLQVTATPYANLLQTEESEMKPDFVHLINPGKGYLGGEFFYNEDNNVVELISELEKDELLKTKEIPLGLRRAILNFIFLCTEYFLEGNKTCNFLIHPSVKIADHEMTEIKVKRFIEEILDDYRNNSSSLTYFAKDVFSTLNLKRSFEEYWKNLSTIIVQIKIQLINSNNATEDYIEGYNIVIGGNSLGRGVTFPNLQITYYCRTSKTPQADTVWQHSRLFGYDREKALCKLYLPPSLFHLFKELTETNDAIFRTLQMQGVDGISILSPEGARPTRRNVLDNDALAFVVGGVNYFLATPGDEHTEEIDEIIKISDSDNDIATVEAIEILEMVTDEEDTHTLKSYINCMRILLSLGHTKCMLHVRVNRDITRGTGTILSPNDRLLSTKYPESLVLFMYRLNGKEEHKWKGKPLWVPNIRFPENLCFYTINEENYKDEIENS